MSKLISLAALGLGVAAYHVYDKYIKNHFTTEDEPDPLKDYKPETDVRSKRRPDPWPVRRDSVLTGVSFHSFYMAKHVMTSIIEAASSKGYVGEDEICDILRDTIEYEYDGPMLDNISNYGFTFMDLCAMNVEMYSSFDEVSYSIKGLPKARNLKFSGGEVLPEKIDFPWDSWMIETPDRSTTYKLAGDIIEKIQKDGFYSVKELYAAIHQGNASPYFTVASNLGWNKVDEVMPYDLSYNNCYHGTSSWHVTDVDPHFCLLKEDE